MISGIIVTLIIAGFLAFIWVEGIDNMNKNWPDYRGEDLLDEYPPTKNKVDIWDDNKQHTEQDIR